METMMGSVLKLRLAPGYHGDCDCGRGPGKHKVWCEFNLTEKDKAFYTDLGITPPKGIWHYVCDTCYQRGNY